MWELSIILCIDFHWVGSLSLSTLSFPLLFCALFTAALWIHTILSSFWNLEDHTYATSNSMSKFGHSICYYS